MNKRYAFATTIGIENWLIDKKVYGACSVLMSQPFKGKICFFHVLCTYTGIDPVPYTFNRDKKPVAS